MIRIFLSHSSKQKKTILKISEYIGRDRCIVDCYDFRSGEKLDDEIKAKIDQSGVFCLLISNTSLSSDWVMQEVQYVKEKVEAGTIQFKAFIIDQDVSPTDARISPWVKNYLLHTIPTAKIISRVLSDNLRELDCQNHLRIKLRDTLFFGRGQALSDLETEHVLKSSVNAIIISGIPHVGRKRFSLQYLRNVTCDDRKSFCVISLERGKSIEDLCLYVNDFVELFEKEELLNILVSENIKRKKDCAIQIINKLYEYKQCLLIDDNFCLIQRNGRIIDWFRDILKSPDLKKHIGIFIISNIGVNYKETDGLPVLQQALSPLDPREIKAIAKAYSEPQGLHIPDQDLIILTKSVKGFPGFVYPIVDAWIQHNRYVAFEKMGELEKGVSDLLEYLIDILNDGENEHKTQLLLLLAHFELISIKQLNELYKDSDLEELLDGFRDLSVLEYFGYSREYIKIHPVVADFLRRSKRVSLSKPFMTKISLRASEIVKKVETPEYEEDIATYLYGIKTLLKEGLSSEKDISRYMIPSLTLNVIVEEYEDKKYPEVVNLCERMLSGSKNYDEHIERSIRYWQCLAFCRTKDPRFFEAVDYFTGHHTYHFLYGFYYRMQELWGKAEKEYDKALKLSGESNENNKIKQELVLVKIKQGDYSGAVLLAEENYKRQRFNSFFIEAYFRCLVQDPYSNPELLKQLISDMEKGQDKNHKEIASTMKAEYEYYFNSDFWQAVRLLQNVMKLNPSMQYSKEAFAAICKKEKQPHVYKDVMKEIK